jgi:hypothetical protein
MRVSSLLAVLGFMLTTGSAHADKSKMRSAKVSMTVAEAAKQGKVVIPEGSLLHVKDRRPVLFDVVDGPKHMIPIMFKDLQPGKYMALSGKGQRELNFEIVADKR